MRRRAMLASIALIAGAGLPGRAPQPALGAQSTPVATPVTPPGAEPEVAIVDAAPNYLAVAVVPDAPAPPALMSLRRVTLQPDVAVSISFQPRSASLILVESGAVTLRADTTVAVIRGGPGGEQAEIPAGDELAASAGDYLAAPAGQVIDGRNLSTEPVRLLLFRVDPATGAPAATGTPPAADGVEETAATVAALRPIRTGTPPAADGVEETVLAAAAADAIPPAPVLLEMLRFTFEPGGSVELPEASPATALILVETGTMTVEMSAPATVHRSAPGATERREDEYPAGTAFTVAAGESMIGQPYAAVTARNAGDEQLTIFMAVIQPAPAP